MARNSNISLSALTVLVSYASVAHAALRTLPHTIVFKNTSDNEQIISIESEYSLTKPATQIGRDFIVRPIAPGKTFTYGGKRYAFTHLEVKLNPVPSTRFLAHAPEGMIIVGLADSVSEVTIFDDDAYTVRNREKFDHKLLRARLRIAAAQKATAEKFRKAGYKMRTFWHKTKHKVANLFSRAKERAEEGKEIVAETAGQAKERLAEGGNRAIEGLGYAKERIAQGAAHATERAGEIAEHIKENFQHGKERARESFEHGKEHAKDTADRVTEKAGETTEHIKEHFEHGKERAHEGAHHVKDCVKDAANRVTEKTGEITERAKEGFDNVKDHFHKGQDRAKHDTAQQDNVKDTFHKGKNPAKKHSKNHLDDDHDEEEEAAHLKQAKERLAQERERALQHAAIIEKRIKEDTSS
jgi:gas vesicle protein